MERKFNVGDRVRIVAFDNLPRFLGTETAVTAISYREPEGEICELDLPNPFGWSERAWIRASYLVPIYDGNDRVSWSDCAWQPRELSRVC